MVAYIVSLDAELVPLMILGLVEVSVHIEMIMVPLVEVLQRVDHSTSRDHHNDCTSSTEVYLN